MKYLISFLVGVFYSTFIASAQQVDSTFLNSKTISISALNETIHLEDLIDNFPPGNSWISHCRILITDHKNKSNSIKCENTRALYPKAPRPDMKVGGPYTVQQIRTEIKEIPPLANVQPGYKILIDRLRIKKQKPGDDPVIHPTELIVTE